MSIFAHDHPAKNSNTHSARALYQLREPILNSWLAKVKAEVKTAGILNNPIIINTIPLFLDGLAEALCQECSRETATESSNIAQEHGGERARVTRYGPEQVIQEYQILREVIKAEVRRQTPLSDRDDLIIQKSFDKAIQESMISYFLVHGRIREQFVATLTHDLRNPIGAVKMAAELILDVVNEDEAALAVVEINDLSKRIIKNAKRADRMIQDMLDASVVQVGERLDLQISKGDIRDVLAEAIGERTKEQAERLKVHNISYIGYWDLDSFQRSIENLINNAFKYGEDKSAVTVRVQQTHDRVMVSVHNFGNPIPAENLENLFQVFRRAEAAKKSGKPGWGIGLALARTTAERMGGSLGVESSAEQGTTFTIDVPADARPFGDAPTSM
jgi:signal transduction histidine kinase